jgi:hypothetical protein
MFRNNESQVGLLITNQTGGKYEKSQVLVPV